MVSVEKLYKVLHIIIELSLGLSLFRSSDIWKNMTFSPEVNIYSLLLRYYLITLSFFLYYSFLILFYFIDSRLEIIDYRICTIMLGVLPLHIEYIKYKIRVLKQNKTFR